MVTNGNAGKIAQIFQETEPGSWLVIDYIGYEQWMMQVLMETLGNGKVVAQEH